MTNFPAKPIILKTLLKKVYDLLPFKKYFFLLIKYIHVPSKRIYQHLHFKGWFSVKIDEKRIDLYHYGYQIENEIFWRGLEGWEGNSLKVWKYLCFYCNVIFDIGANTGIYALVAKSVNPGSKVYAYEPVKRVCDKLKLNVKKNCFDIIVEEFAISNNDGKAIIYDQPTEHIYSVSVNKKPENSVAELIPTNIDTIKLSTIIEQQRLSSLDLVKIDVEMHEGEVLEGMDKYLRQFKPIILIEILTVEVAEKVNQIFRNSNNIYYEIDEKHGLIPRRNVSTSKTEGYNYLIIPKPKHELLLPSIKQMIVVK